MFKDLLLPNHLLLARPPYRYEISLLTIFHAEARDWYGFHCREQRVMQRWGPEKLVILVSK